MPKENLPSTPLEQDKDLGGRQQDSMGGPGAHTNPDGHEILTDRFGQSIDTDATDPTGRSSTLGKHQGTIWGG